MHTHKHTYIHTYRYVGAHTENGRPKKKWLMILPPWLYTLPSTDLMYMCMYYVLNTCASMHIYIYIYICVCVCVCMYMWLDDITTVVVYFNKH